MFVCCECCVLLCRGLSDGLITRPEESYRLWRVVCDQETSRMRRLKPATGLWKIEQQRVVTPRKQETNVNVWLNEGANKPNLLREAASSNTRGVTFQHNNVTPHNTHCTQQLLQSCRCQVPIHPPSIVLTLRPRCLSFGPIKQYFCEVSDSTIERKWKTVIREWP
jgi:hypothetical protein